MRHISQQILAIALLCVSVSCSKTDETSILLNVSEFKAYAAACGMALECKTIPAEKLEIKHVNSGMDKDLVKENLKEIEKLPAIFRYMLSESTQITTTEGGVSNAEGYEYLADQEARGWGGLTYSSVPGISVIQNGVCNVVVGTLPTGSGSLMLHELSHCIDKVVGLSEKSTDLINLYDSYLEDPVEEDPNSAYSLSHPQEFFAEQITLIYQSDDSKDQFDEWYPESKELFEENLLGEIIEAVESRSLLAAFE
jgi:hypothetical protein